MPLREHFRPPVSKRSSWEGFHAMWPTAMIQSIRDTLPFDYVAEPRVRLGSLIACESAGEYEYAVRVYDADRDRTLVAAVEIASPANKVRPQSRTAFVAKCAEMIRRGVAVSVIDLVTVRHFNLYAELMAFLGHPTADPMSADPPPTYAASCRQVERGTRGEKTILETWSHTLAVGRALPTLPLWLSDTHSIPIDLEASYEQACRDLRIP